MVKNFENHKLPSSPNLQLLIKLYLSHLKTRKSGGITSISPNAKNRHKCDCWLFLSPCWNHSAHTEGHLCPSPSPGMKLESKTHGRLSVWFPEHWLPTGNRRMHWRTRIWTPDGSHADHSDHSDQLSSVGRRGERRRGEPFRITH